MASPLGSPRVEVDWDGDGAFGHARSDVTADVEGVTARRGSGRLGDEVVGGTASVVLHNASGDYSPFATGGPLAGKLRVGRAVRVTVAPPGGGAALPFFAGVVQEVVQQLRPARVTLALADAFERLRAGVVAVPVQRDATASALIGAVLDAAGWPAGARSIEDVGETTRWFYPWDLTPLETLRQAARGSPGARLWADRAGRVAYQSARARSRAASAVTLGPQVDVDSVSAGLRAADAVKEVSARWAQTTAGAIRSPVYAHGGPVRVPAGGSASVRAAFRPGAVRALRPQEGTDWAASTSATGAGERAAGALTVTRFEQYGGGFEVEWTMTSPLWLQRGLDLWVLGPGDDGGDWRVQERGFEVRAVRLERAEQEAVAAVSGAMNTDRAVEMDWRWYEDGEALRGYARSRAAAYATPHARPRLRVLPRLDAEVGALLAVDVGSRVTLAAGSGLDGEYIVAALDERLSAAAGYESATWTLESPPLADADLFIVGESAIGGPRRIGW